MTCNANVNQQNCRNYIERTACNLTRLTFGMKEIFSDYVPNFNLGLNVDMLALLEWNQRVGSWRGIRDVVFQT